MIFIHLLYNWLRPCSCYLNNAPTMGRFVTRDSPVSMGALLGVISENNVQ
ncbi:hypothetical protein Hanom_Chr15g01364121 [Helianthus anomalus]